MLLRLLRVAGPGLGCGLPGPFFLVLRTVSEKCPPPTFRDNFVFSCSWCGCARIGLRVPALQNVCSGARAHLFGGAICSGPYAGIIKAAHRPGHGQGGPLPAGALACIFQTSHAWWNVLLNTCRMVLGAPQVAWNTFWDAPRLPGSPLLCRGVPPGV